MINHYKKPLILLLGCLSLFSCTKETVIAPATPSAISELRAWTAKTDPLKLASSIAWEAAIPIKLSDSVSAYAAPVRNTYPAAISPDFMEFITFELAGKRYGLYKSYRRLNETDMEIIIQSIEGKTLKAGFLRKKKALIPKGKSVSMREMNLDMEIAFIYEYIMGILLNNVNVYGTGGGGGYVWGYTRPNSMNYYRNYEGGGSVENRGEGSYNFSNYAYPEITNTLKSECFNQVLSDLIFHNLKGKMAHIIELFDNTKAGGKFDFTIVDSYNEPFKGFGDIFKSAKTDGKTINLNTATLSNSSKEYTAKTIMHEILHIYIGNIRALEDHTKMATEFITPMAELLSEIYPINLREAKIICTIGLDSIDKDLFEKVLAKIDTEKPVTADERDKIFFGHTNLSKNRYGKYCN
ncbi:MAG: hypothetical protein RLZ10_2097 [Bacteroidota bacterium]|jgi:hypothetical protein